ncbi:MAG: hypothetical protein INF10_04915, partial [Methylobacterium sp.]|nr:hypothetical protein [Methylobacterium sp.]
LEPQCVAAAAAFGRASLRKIREAEEPGFKGTPAGRLESAVLARPRASTADLDQMDRVPRLRPVPTSSGEDGA